MAGPPSWAVPRIRASIADARSQAGLATTLGRLARDLPPFLRTPRSLAAGRRRIAEQLAGRDERFLSLAERGIYAVPDSPFRALLRSAGCEPGDLRSLVAREGLEGALTTLAERGVYLTHDEAKGRVAVQRGSVRLVVRPVQVRNVLAPGHLILLTGGSGRQPHPVLYSLDYFRESAESLAAVLAAHGVQEPRLAYWWPIPLWMMLTFAAIGAPSLRWFLPGGPLPRRARLYVGAVRLLARGGGVSLPAPEACDAADPTPLVAFLAAELRRGAGLVVWATPSGGVALAHAATERGVSLDGLTIVASGEPVTNARRAAVVAAGARMITCYSTIDVAAPAYACAASAEPDDLHAMTHRFAVVTRPTPAAPGGPSVDALLVTSISSAMPRLALNVMTGDYGRLRTTACGCDLGALGLTTHLSEIGSFEKLTGEGVTFARSELQAILETALPARFGGTLLDYQLVEEAGPDGRTGLILRASPRIGPLDEAALRAAFLDELGRRSMLAEYQARIWERARTVRIRREEPTRTPAGKVLPLDRAGAAAASGREPA